MDFWRTARAGNIDFATGLDLDRRHENEKWKSKTKMRSFMQDSLCNRPAPRGAPDAFLQNGAPEAFGEESLTLLAKRRAFLPLVLCLTPLVKRPDAAVYVLLAASRDPNRGQEALPAPACKAAL